MPGAVTIQAPSHDPIASTLSVADDRIVPSHWLPPALASWPHIRIGQHWFSLLRAIPIIGAPGLMLLIAPAQGLRDLPGVQVFIGSFPEVRRAVFSRWRMDPKGPLLRRPRSLQQEPPADHPRL